MTLDLIQFLTHVLRWHELIKNVTRLDATWGQISVIVIEGFDCGKMSVSISYLITVWGKPEALYVLWSSGSEWKRCLNVSVFLVACEVHVSHSSSLSASSTNFQLSS